VTTRQQGRRSRLIRDERLGGGLFVPFVPGGDGLPAPDMWYDPQWIVDTYGTTTALDGDDLAAAGKMFAVGQRWKSLGSKDNWIDLHITGGGATTIQHAAGPNGLPYVFFDGVTNPGEWMHPNRDGNEPAATEGDFHPSAFTYFVLAARATTETTGWRSVMGTRDIPNNRGFSLFFRESGGARNLQFVFGDGSIISGATAGTWAAGEWMILAIMHDGSEGKLWKNTLFASPIGSAVHGYAPRNTGSIDHQGTFQLGQDGGEQTRAETLVADLRMYNRVLSEAEFDSIMSDLSAKSGIAVT